MARMQYVSSSFTPQGSWQGVTSDGKIFVSVNSNYLADVLKELESKNEPWDQIYYPEYWVETEIYVPGFDRDFVVYIRLDKLRNLISTYPWLSLMDVMAEFDCSDQEAKAALVALRGRNG